MNSLEKIIAFGHQNILCQHTSTIEITKEQNLTTRGTCILGVNASKACFDLNPDLKKKIINGAKVKIKIEVGNLTDSFIGYGDQLLTLKDKRDMVFRKSDFICDRTILIRCSKSSFELNRKLIKNLRNPGKSFTITLESNDLDEI